MSKSGSVVIDQLIICSSYQEAISVSKTFDKFSFKVFFLGNRQTVRARRFIRKIESSKEYSHKVVVRYTWAEAWGGAISKLMSLAIEGVMQRKPVKSKDQALTR